MVFGPSWLLGHCTSANKSPNGIHTKRNITQQGSAVWPDQPHCMTQQSKGKCSPWLSGLCGRGDTTPLPQEPKGTIITCNSNKPHRSFSCSVVRLVNKHPVYCPFLWHTRGKHMLSLQWSSKTKQDFSCHFYFFSSRSRLTVKPPKSQRVNLERDLAGVDINK